MAPKPACSEELDRDNRWKLLHSSNPRRASSHRQPFGAASKLDRNQTRDEPCGRWQGFSRGFRLYQQPAHSSSAPCIQLAFASLALLEAITSIRSFQELTNDLAPSSWSFAPKSSMSIPAAATSSSTASQSPPSADMISLRSPWSARAFKVPSGIVFTVKGAASALIYSTSDAWGPLVPVLAHNKRCGRAPAL